MSERVTQAWKVVAGLASRYGWANHHRLELERVIDAALQAERRATWRAAVKVVESHIEPASPSVDTGSMWRNVMVTTLAAALAQRAGGA